MGWTKSATTKSMARNGIAQDATGRREFLRAAGSAGLAPPLRNWLAGREPAPLFRGANDRINLAFLGTGCRGTANLAHSAQVPGFHVVAVCDLETKDCGEILADPSIDAVCIAAPVRLQAHLTVRACRAGKDVYVEPPVFGRLEEGPAMVEAARRFNRVVQAGTALRSGAVFHEVREIVRSGELGGVTFCRIAGAKDPLPLIDLVQFLFDEAAPVSLDAQSGAGTIGITLRYPGFLASYQSAPDPWGVSIHGSRATLTVSRSGYSLFPAGPEQTAVEQPCDPHVAHWKNFLECIRTRRRPAGDIESCVRSTEACLRAGLAMRHEWISG